MVPLSIAIVDWKLLLLSILLLLLFFIIIIIIIYNNYYYQLLPLSITIIIHYPNAPKFEFWFGSAETLAGG